MGNEANQNAIANPSVSYHMDGIYVASPFALHTNFLDVERIEVLRGPQGTLFGQNSTGGAINVVSEAPTPLFEGRGDVTVGNHNLLRTRASINVPLGETLAARAAVAAHRHDGFSNNLVLDQGLDEADSASARVRVGWTPSETFRVDLIAQVHDRRHQRRGAEGHFGHYAECARTAPGFAWPICSGFAPVQRGGAVGSASRNAEVAFELSG